MMVQAITRLLIVKEMPVYFRVARLLSTENSKSSNHLSGSNRERGSLSVLRPTNRERSLPLPFLPIVHPPLNRFLIVCSAVGHLIDGLAEHLSLPWSSD
jgi:hypothetical protein